MSIDTPNAMGVKALLNPAEVRDQRDKALAIAYVERGGKPRTTVIRDLAIDAGLNERTVRRGVYRMLVWAEREVKRRKRAEKKAAKEVA